MAENLFDQVTLGHSDMKLNLACHQAGCKHRVIHCSYHWGMHVAFTILSLLFLSKCTSSIEVTQYQKTYLAH